MSIPYLVFSGSRVTKITPQRVARVPSVVQPKVVTQQKAVVQPKVVTQPKAVVQPKVVVQKPALEKPIVVQVTIPEQPEQKAPVQTVQQDTIVFERKPRRKKDNVENPNVV